ncbi:MAG TPA: hypothetical protein VN932_11720 [Rhizomicrobium sp.]|nr:hypothetical protein [Rhizomicrobium sp.]
MAAKSKKAASGKLDKRLDALVSDLEALQSDVRGLAQGAGVEAGSRISEALKAAEARVANAVRAAEDAATQAVGEAEDWAVDNMDSLRDTVREQPLTACLVAAGIGAVFGVLFLRR